MEVKIIVKPEPNKDKWKCACCKRHRESEFISERIFDISEKFGLQETTLFLNCRYCMDSVECKIKANNMQWVIFNLLKRLV